jgi:hypothetical protein
MNGGFFMGLAAIPALLAHACSSCIRQIWHPDLSNLRQYPLAAHETSGRFTPLRLQNPPHCALIG